MPAVMAASWLPADHRTAFPKNGGDMTSEVMTALVDEAIFAKP